MSSDFSETSLRNGLIGHWPLTHDEKDVSASGLSTRAVNVAFDATKGASFRGHHSFLEVPKARLTELGAGDFTLAAFVNLDRAPDDALGDIACVYDFASRRGFHLSVLNLSGVTSSHSNYRTLSFGMDQGTTPAWRDVGRPGNGRFVCALAVFDGHLYAGTFESGEQETGHVYRYDGDEVWSDCGAPDPCNAVTTLAVYNGRLYAGVSRYKAGGSALPESLNQSPGGKVYRYEGGATWTSCGTIGDVDTAWAMAVHDGHLYVIPIYQQGMWRYDGDAQWTYCGTPGVRLMAIGVFGGRLYGAGNEGNKAAGVYRYEGGTDWALCGRLLGVDQVYSFAAHHGAFYAGTWPDAAVFRLDGEDTWTHCGRLGDEMEVMPMVVYNGRLYAGTLPLAEVYRYDGSTNWSFVGRLDRTPDVKYRRVWSMALFQGKLFCGTLPSGRVHALQVGVNATYDRALGSGWRHVAAVRRNDRLELYVDGEHAGRSDAFVPTDYDLTTDAPLRIGAGPNDGFNGDMRDLRLYRRALSLQELHELASQQMSKTS